jgi:hypothetical protein
VKAYITKNLWEYEELNPAPQLLDDTFFKFYITDDVNSKEKVSITDDVTVGLNSCVVKSIYESGIYVGLPAKLINK